MKWIRWIAFVCLGLLPALPVAAYDFSAVVPSGQTLYFNIVGNSVVVTYPANVVQPVQGWSGYTQPTGALTIPATVADAEGNVYTVTAVGSHAFYGCSGLTSVTLSNGIVAVRGNAFNGCTALTDVVLPASIDSLGNNAFKLCTSLASVTIYRATPPTTATSAFSEVDLSACTLYVACSGVVAYSAATPWSQFGTIDDTGCTATLTATANYAVRGSVSGGGTYTVGTSVVLLATPAEGYFFACWGDGDTLNPRVVSLTEDRQLTAHFFAFRHDTVTLATPVHDTIYLTQTVHDTVAVHDTVDLGGSQPTFYHLTVESADAWHGLAVGSCVVPAGTMIEICGLPVEGYAFDGWSDGTAENPRRVQVTGDCTYTARFTTASVEAPAAAAWSATVSGRVLTVSCEAGERLSLYDMQGRCLLATATTAGRTSVVLPAAGAYLVQVADGLARRVVTTE